MKIVGEPVENLFLWGHSACLLNDNDQNQILIFGGFGGLGRHARRNDCLMLEPWGGFLKDINASHPPTARMGHTASVVGNRVFVIGGRNGPAEILSDVVVLDINENKWTLLHCSGANFHPRHRHAAAVVGPNIYVFGGLNNGIIFSTMLVLNTETLQWHEVNIEGESPSARYSHSLISHGSFLFLFGGYDGEQALDDLYIFNVVTLSWRKARTTGRSPFPRFSHSAFIYKNYLGLIGGCPVNQKHQEIALLDLTHHVWKHVKVDSVNRELLIRGSAIVVSNDLILVGGGVSCYAFGAKFSPPTKISLLSICSDETHCSFCQQTIENGNASPAGCLDAMSEINGLKLQHNDLGRTTCDKLFGIDKLAEVEHSLNSWPLMLQIEKKHAKIGKDILKQKKWLDLGRKAELSQDGQRVCLPVSYVFIREATLHLAGESDILEASYLLGSATGKGLQVNEISSFKAMCILLMCGGGILIDDRLPLKKCLKSPQFLMKDAVRSLIDSKGMPQNLLEQLPTRWDRIGDITVLPVASFKDQLWDSVKEELWPIVAKSLGAHRLARQGRILPTGTRDSTLEILLGADGWVSHHENGISYSFDATKCMFSWGNLSEKLRMARLDCRDEIVVDLFAGIGYFVLPFLVKSKAKLVYACEWNPYAIKALRHNTQANDVADRCIILEGDNRLTAPKGVADRVCLGLLPTSEDSWHTAVRALRSTGGILHVHGNVKDVDERAWSDYVVKSIESIAKSEGYNWDVSVQHLERVKWYGPHIRHVVSDIRCRTVS